VYRKGIPAASYLLQNRRCRGNVVWCVFGVVLNGEEDGGKNFESPLLPKAILGLA
jgi:hypothetical protein